MGERGGYPVVLWENGCCRGGERSGGRTVVVLWERGEDRGEVIGGTVGGEAQRVKYSVVILAGKLLSKGKEGQPVVLWQNGWCGGRDGAKGRLLGGALVRYSAISFRFNGMFGGRGSASEE